MGELVTRVDGVIVGVGTTVGVLLGSGVLPGVGVPALPGVTVASLGRTDSAAAGAGVTTGLLGAGLAASGRGTSGVSRLGPPSTLLTTRIR